MENEFRGSKKDSEQSAIQSVVVTYFGTPYVLPQIQERKVGSEECQDECCWVRTLRSHRRYTTNREI